MFSNFSRNKQLRQQVNLGGIVVAKYSLHPFVQATPCNQYTDAIGSIYVYSRCPALSYFLLLAVVIATLLFTDRASKCRMPWLLYDEEGKSGCHYK
jgi:hypothetical protein